jgi:quercetin dioxygenase-like cupin family protein
MTAESSVMVAPRGGEFVLRGGVGAIRKISSVATGGTFSMVEHPLEPGALAAPPHTHADVDEYSFVIEGEIGVLLGEETLKAADDAYVLKPRGVPTRSGIRIRSRRGLWLRTELADAKREVPG